MVEENIKYYNTEEFITNCQSIFDKLTMLFGNDGTNNYSSEQFNSITHEVYGTLKTINDAPRVLKTEEEGQNFLYKCYADLLEIYTNLQGWYYSLDETRRELETVTDPEEKEVLNNELKGTIDDIKGLYRETLDISQKALEAKKTNTSSI